MMWRIRRPRARSRAIFGSTAATAYSTLIMLMMMVVSGLLCLVQLGLLARAARTVLQGRRVAVLPIKGRFQILATSHRPLILLVMLT